MITEGTAAGGTVTIKCGSKTAAVTITALGTNWQELRIGNEALAGSENETDQWFRNFNEDPFDVEISWAGGTSGTLLVDDVIFAPYTLVDGTWWILRQDNTAVAPAHPTPWLVDDLITITDTGGAAGTGDIQWWYWVAYNQYLPTANTTTFGT